MATRTPLRSSEPIGEIRGSASAQPNPGAMEDAMSTRRFWSAFAAGAAAGASAATATVLTWKMVGRVRGNGRILRFEKSIQIGRSVDEVFSAWSNLENLPQFIDFIRSVERRGNRTHWVMN